MGRWGKKVHTGRSRNDQVLTAIRLYTKEQLLVVSGGLLELAGAFLDFAKKYEYVPMPGYTHMQKAMPSSLGMWAGASAESLLDDLVLLKASYKLNDQSPLGSAAAYGVPLNLDREYTAKILGFEKVQSNSLYCQNSRGKIEASIISSLVLILQTINRFASDVLLFTTSEFNYFNVAKELCTGSSIMPQKRNVDIAELLRTKVTRLISNYLQVVGISSNLISGYNRDLQDTKKSLMESLETTLGSLIPAKILLEGITPNVKVLEEAMTDEIFATHKAIEMVKKGVSFREAYGKVNGEKYIKMQNAKWKMQNEGEILKEILSEAGHVGGTGNLGIMNYELRIMNERKKLLKEREKFEGAIETLFGEEV